MSRHIIFDYLNQHPNIKLSDLPNIYVYFKFKAYLQTTLRCTRKAYCIKEGVAAQTLSYIEPQELYQLSDSQSASVTYESPYDVDWAIGQLEPSQAEVIRLYFYSGKTDLEIARSRNVTRQAVNNLKRRALHNLRELLYA